MCIFIPPLMPILKSFYLTKLKNSHTIHLLLFRCHSKMPILFVRNIDAWLSTAHQGQLAIISYCICISFISLVIATISLTSMHACMAPCTQLANEMVSGTTGITKKTSTTHSASTNLMLCMSSCTRYKNSLESRPQPCTSSCKMVAVFETI